MTDALPDRFINYRLVPNPATGKSDKIPCDTQGHKIDPHQPHQWRTFEDAAATGYGVGFVFNGDGWFLLDLDDCREGDAWNAEASAIFQSFAGAYGEVSTSGKGLHVIGRCDPTLTETHRNKWDGDKEFYTDGRFVALSREGLQVIGGGEFTGTDWSHQLRKLVPERPFLGDLPDGRDPAYTGPEDDDTLIEKMLAARGSASAQFGGVTIRDLWEANAAKLGDKYPDPVRDYDASAADAALMSHLAFWTGKDMPRMDRLFRRSALMRDKYEKRADYRRDTIQGAARMCKAVFNTPPRVTSAAPGGTLTLPGFVSDEVFLTPDEMKRHFAGCVYVRDNHRVLVPDGSLLKPEQFNASYGGHVFSMMPDGTKPTNEAFKALTQSAAVKFPQAKRTCFRPDQPPGAIIDDEVNIYVKPDVDMRPGDVTPFLDFFRRLLPDERDRQILLSWCAAALQYPAVKFQWAPVLQGVEGNGKSLLASCLIYAIGPQFAYEPRSSQLAAQFISFDEHRLLIVVEEFYGAHRREILDELKPRITNQRIEVEAKGQDRRLIRNTANWIFCTNHRDAVAKSRNDRRYAIFYTAQQAVEDLTRDGMSGEFFPALYRWLRTGGYAHVAHYLANYEIPDDLNPATSCHRAPITSTTAEAIAATMGGIESEIVEASQSGRVGFRGGWVSSWALDQLLRDRGMRCAAPKRGEILRNLGYTCIGRAQRPVVREDGLRPNLWTLAPESGTMEAYLEAQGQGYL